MRTLTMGMSGADVRAWQIFLQSKNFDPGGIDGAVGTHTEQATRGYQQSSPTVF